MRKSIWRSFDGELKAIGTGAVALVHHDVIYYEGSAEESTLSLAPSKDKDTARPICWIFRLQRSLFSQRRSLRPKRFERAAVAGRTDGRLGPEEVTDDIINNPKPYIYVPLLLLLLPPHCAGD